MSLIFITGNSGAGKSSVRKELQRRGYETYDTDDDGITVWRHKTTNEIVERSDRTKEWYDEHEWKMSRQRVEELAARAKKKTIFLCGSPTNADEMVGLYDRVICLSVDKNTLRDRIAARTDHDDFGKAPNELMSILGWHESFENRYRNYGAIMIDTTKSLHEVVDDIVGSTSELS